MKRIKVSDIANAAIRTAAEQRKLTSAFLVETDPLRPNAFLYYMPLGTEVIDDGGTTIWTDSPGFAAVKARILRPPPLVKDLISQLRDTPGKSIVKIKVGDAEVPLTNVDIVGSTIVLS